MKSMRLINFSLNLLKVAHKYLNKFLIFVVTFFLSTGFVLAALIRDKLNIEISFLHRIAKLAINGGGCNGNQELHIFRDQKEQFIKL